MVWYGMGEYDSLQLDRKVNEYMDKSFFAATTCCEFELEPTGMRLLEIGFKKGEIFHPISESQFSMPDIMHWNWK
jgi:hypothetical protein